MAFNHISQQFMVPSSNSLSFVRLLFWLMMVVSSANNMVLRARIFGGKSFIKTRKRIGPRIEPCGMPTVRGFKFDSLDFSYTLCVRSVKYDFNKSWSVPLMP